MDYAADEDPRDYEIGHFCKFCDRPLGPNDYPAVPAHGACITAQQKKDKPCNRCGKPHEESPRAFGSNLYYGLLVLRPQCLACDRKTGGGKRNGD